MHAVYNSAPVPNYPRRTRLHRYSAFVSLNCVVSQQVDRFSFHSHQPVLTAVGHVPINGSVADYGANLPPIYVVSFERSLERLKDFNDL